MLGDQLGRARIKSWQPYSKVRSIYEQSASKPPTFTLTLTSGHVTWYGGIQHTVSMLFVFFGVLHKSGLCDTLYTYRYNQKSISDCTE